MLTLADLGILRDVVVTGNAVEVVITPTYSACPAMAQIEQDVQQVLRDAGRLLPLNRGTASAIHSTCMAVRAIST